MQSIRKAHKVIKRIGVRDGDIVLVKTEEDANLVKVAVEHLGIRCAIIVGDYETVTHIPAEELHKAGYYQIPTKQ